MTWFAGAALGWPLSQQRLEEVGRIGLQPAPEAIEPLIEIASQRDGVPDTCEQHDQDHGQERRDGHNELGHFDLPAGKRRSVAAL